MRSRFLSVFFFDRLTIVAWQGALLYEHAPNTDIYRSDGRACSPSRHHTLMWLRNPYPQYMSNYMFGKVAECHSPLDEVSSHPEIVKAITSLHFEETSWFSNTALLTGIQFHLFDVVEFETAAEY